MENRMCVWDSCGALVREKRGMRCWMDGSVCDAADSGDRVVYLSDVSEVPPEVDEFIFSCGPPIKVIDGRF